MHVFRSLRETAVSMGRDIPLRQKLGSAGPGIGNDETWKCPLSIFTGALLTSPRPLPRDSQYLCVPGTGKAEPPNTRSPKFDVSFLEWSSAGSVYGSEGRVLHIVFHVRCISYSESHLLSAPCSEPW